MGQARGGGAKVQNVFYPRAWIGVFDRKNRYFDHFLAKLGYFWVLPIWPNLSKPGPKLRAFSENLTIRGKYGRTHFFTLARVKMSDFPLGANLLRSARSFRDVLPFSATNEPTDAVTSIPQTA